MANETTTEETNTKTEEASKDKAISSYDTSDELSYQTYVSSISNSLVKSGSIVNIITNYPWSVNYKTQNIRKRVPAVYVIEYEQGKSTFATSARWMAQHASSSFKSLFSKETQEALKLNDEGTKGYNNTLHSKPFMNPYRNMYSLTESGIRYIFPYYNAETDSQLSTSYGDSPTADSLGQNSLNDIFKIGQNVAANLENFKQLVSAFDNNSGVSTNGIYIERPKFFQMPTSNDSISVDFTLFNTVPINGTSSIIPWERNYNLIKALTVKNLPFKTSVFKFISPVLYQVICPGLKHFPVSYISSFSVKPKGIKTLAKYNNQEVLVPEAWDFSIKFTSLLLPSANLSLSGYEGLRSIKISTI